MAAWRRSIAIGATMVRSSWIMTGMARLKSGWLRAREITAEYRELKNGIHEWAGHAIALVEGARLVPEEEVKTRLDESRPREGVEEVKVDEGVAVIFGGVGEASEVYEV